ncbi:fluoride efflux transporter FluC [Streptococcus sp. zg-JUN1979]|uniref:fluoride efflux transporter FluC n=1 Tax=Streptococcus sp. zg-JUN1979 TaxID=3391450 RepID=UPI0039A77A13
MIISVIFALAGLGGIWRFYLSRLNDKKRYPLGTFVANSLGCLMLGFIYKHFSMNSLYLFLGTGFCGGLTTFSTFQSEIFQLRQSPARAFIYVMGTCSVGLLAIGLGYLL